MIRLIVEYHEPISPCSCEMVADCLHDLQLFLLEQLDVFIEWIVYVYPSPQVLDETELLVVLENTTLEMMRMMIHTYESSDIDTYAGNFKCTYYDVEELIASLYVLQDDDIHWLASELAYPLAHVLSLILRNYQFDLENVYTREIMTDGYRIHVFIDTHED